MEKIDEQLNNLSVIDIPNGMHQDIMRSVNYQKVNPTILVAFFLLVLNFLMMAWHINTRLIDADFLNMARDVFNVFDFNIASIGTIISSFFEVVPLSITISAVLSLAGAIYLLTKINIYNLRETYFG